MTPTLRSTNTKDKGKTTSNSIKKTATKTTPKTISTASNKRILSPDPTIANSTNPKKNKANELSTMELEDLKRLINASTEKIESKIETSYNALEGKIKDLADKVNDDVSALNSTVVDFHTKINVELNDVKTQLSLYSERIDNNDDDFLRTQRNQDLRLTGFEYKEDENVNDIYNQVAAAIGFNIGPNTAMPAIERVSLYNRTSQKNTPSKTILLHFAILRQKQHFYAT